MAFLIEPKRETSPISRAHVRVVIGPHARNRSESLDPVGQHRIALKRTRCLVPAFDGAYFSDLEKEVLWDSFYTGAPQRQRRSVERYNIVKRA
jgi:hypothetical protein